MSRWIDAYNNPSYSEAWPTLLTAINEVTLDDESVATNVAEVARLKKASKYLDGILKGIDPELTPFTVLGNLSKQVTTAKQQIDNYTGTRDIQQIKNVNATIDTLLSQFQPFALATGDAAAALSEAAIDAADRINDHFLNLQKEAQDIKESLEKQDTQASTLISTIANVRDRASEFEKETFGAEGIDGTKQKIDQLVSEFESARSSINQYNDEIHAGNEETPSIKQQIATAKEHIETEKENISALLTSVQQKTEALKDFHAKVFGDEGSEEKHKGLAGEIEVRRKELKEFANEQAERYTALNDQINSLLPGATSTGLAHAYHEMKTSFDQPIKSANYLFYGAIGTLVVLSILLSVESIGGDHIVKFVELTSWESMLQNILLKLPVYLPVLWLAFYASKRRSEYHRLQQEYAHKEALAKSYHSYKQQIEALNSEDPEMLQSLIQRSIDTIAFNAAETLDKRHGDKSPLHEVAEKTVSTVAQTATSKSKT